MSTKKHVNWMRFLIAALFIAGVFGAFPGASSAAEKYPARSIQVVIGFEPGSTDMAVRVFTDKLGEVLGQPMPFLYKPGAAGSVGALFVAKSKPDGYTLMGASLGPLITSPLTMKGLNYTLDDFTPICMISAQATALVVKNDARWKTLKEFIDEAKKTPGKLTYATSGVFGTNHIPMEMLQKTAGFSITHIPTTGSGPSVTAVLGGHVDMTVAPMSAVTPHLRSGTLRALAFIHKGKVQEFPNVPTLVDLGYPITYSGWFALVGPKGIPQDVLQTLYNACDRVMEVYAKTIDTQFKNMSQDPAYIKGPELAKELRSDWDMTKKIVDEIEKSKK